MPSWTFRKRCHYLSGLPMSTKGLDARLSSSQINLKRGHSFVEALVELVAFFATSLIFVHLMSFLMMGKIMIPNSNQPLSKCMCRGWTVGSSQNQAPVLKLQFECLEVVSVQGMFAKAKLVPETLCTLFSLRVICTN